LEDSNHHNQEKPQHVAIIMDGNGRWAKQRGLPRLAGHKAGTDNIQNIVRACVDEGVPYLTVYAFSTENWERPEAEVQGLMEILGQVIREQVPILHEEGVQIRHLGSLEEVSGGLAQAIRESVELTKNNEHLVLNIAFNYGGRAEIVHAVRRLVEDGIPATAVTEEEISNRLYTAGSPDPDLIIRTGGEYRLSNFLIWQAAYAEYWSTPVFWPDFNREELQRALAVFASRDRRFGRLSDE
jgi:undecaprenyl diphosphate synthase